MTTKRPAIWEGLKYGPAITNLGYIAWKNNETGRAESLFKRAINDDPLHSVEARNNIAQILRDKARKASSTEEKKNYVGQAVSNLRTVLALDSNNLQAFSTLAFIYYDMNMLEMAKLVGNQAIKKADEIATGKFEEEKVEEAAEGKAAGKAARARRRKKEKGEKKGDDEEAAKPKEIGREAGTGVTGDMKKQLAVVHNTLGLVELKKKNISPAIKQFKEAVGLNPNFAEARLNLAALSLNNRDYLTAEENFKRGDQAAAEELRGRRSAWASRCAATRRSTRRRRSTTPPRASTRRRAPATSTSGCSTRSTRTARSRRCRRRRTTTASSSATRRAARSESLKKEAEKRIKDIDEIYVALEEAAKMQAESEAMQKKAEEQQKKMEEEMKKQEAAGEGREPRRPLPTRLLRQGRRRQGRGCRCRAAIRPRHGRRRPGAAAKAAERRSGRRRGGRPAAGKKGGKKKK